MDPATIALILRLLDLGVWALSRLPVRNEEHEKALMRLKDMIALGVIPTEEDYKKVLDAISAQASIRDNLIALKGE